jgi:hypothetical protein
MRWHTKPGNLDALGGAVSHTFPPQHPGRHGWAELLTLVGAVRRLAFDPSLPAPEALGRIRDAYADYDQGGMP